MCCGRLTVEDRKKKMAFVAFLKKALLPGVMGTNKKDIPSWSQFLGQDFKKQRKYIVAIIQYLNQENFPNLPFGNAFISSCCFHIICACLLVSVVDFWFHVFCLFVLQRWRLSTVLKLSQHASRGT